MSHGQFKNLDYKLTLLQCAKWKEFQEYSENIKQLKYHNMSDGNFKLLWLKEFKFSAWIEEKNSLPHYLLVWHFWLTLLTFVQRTFPKYSTLCHIRGTLSFEGPSPVASSKSLSMWTEVRQQTIYWREAKACAEIHWYSLDMLITAWGTPGPKRDSSFKSSRILL